MDDAKKAAAQADVTILIVGANRSVEEESRDRVSLLLPGQQGTLVSEVAKASRGPVILVIMSAGGFDISFAKSNDKISSILWIGYPGQHGGTALADVIFGSYNPSMCLSNYFLFVIAKIGFKKLTYQYYVGKLTSMNERRLWNFNYPIEVIYMN